MKSQAKRVLGQSLLVAGSAVGAGLLALPSVTWRASFTPSAVALTAIWAYMASAGLLLIEVASWMDPTRPAHLLGMARLTLGGAGRAMCFALYATVYSATMTAYLAEGGRQAAELVGVVVGGEDASRRIADRGDAVAVAQVLFAAAFGCVIFKGSRQVERLNSVCMVGAIVAFCVLVRAVMTATATAEGDGSDALDREATFDEADSGTEASASRAKSDVAMGGGGGGGKGGDWSAVPRALPVMVVAFSYHNMVPSVFSALGRETRSSGLAVLLGSGVSLIMYVAWQAVTLGGNGSRPPPSEERIFAKLREAAGLALPLFSLLALVTSLLGVGLGCVDFMEDALLGSASFSSTATSSNARFLFGSCASMPVASRRRSQATLLTFGPCLVCAVAFPGAFLPALEFSGVFRQVLFGAMPLAMVWRGRKFRRESGKLLQSDDELPPVPLLRAGSDVEDGASKGGGELLPGGTFGLGFMAAVTASLIVIELKHVVHGLLSAPAYEKQAIGS